MNKLLTFLLLIFVNTIAVAQDENLSITAIQAYIQKYKTIAMNEQMRVGIPASITLAQGIHESAASTSDLATKANNHFGIKCKKGWEGQTFLHDDDALQECFRKYKSDVESYEDHSNYLKNNRRYSFLFDIPLDNYKEWAVGLRKAGYATNPKYSARLTELIEKYKLNQYTEQANQAVQKLAEKKVFEEMQLNKKELEDVQIEKTKQKLKKTQSPELEDVKSSKLENDINGFANKLKTIVINNGDEELLNGLRGFYAKKGDLLLKEAVARKIKYAKLLELNDLNESPLASDMFIYIEKKYKKSPLKRNHLVQENETMHMIAQAEGMQLKALLSLNLLETEEEPATGARVYLQEEVSRKPELKNSEIKKNSLVAIEKNITTTSPKKLNAKSEDVNVANTLFAKNDIEKQNTIVPAKKVDVLKNTEIDIVAIEKSENKINDVAIENNEATKNTAAEIAEQQAKLGDEIANAKQQELLAIEKIEADRLIALASSKAEAEKEVTRKKEELEKAEILANEKIKIIIEKPLPEIISKVAPAPKSPSTYSEDGVSPELHKMKKIMDEIVYAIPPAIKPKKALTDSDKIIAPPVITKKINPIIPAKNPNKPTAKSTLPLDASKKSIKTIDKKVKVITEEAKQAEKKIAIKSIDTKILKLQKVKKPENEIKKADVKKNETVKPKSNIKASKNQKVDKK